MKKFIKNNNRNHEFNDHDLPRKKKHFGQHFLRKQSVVDHMINTVKIDEQTNVLEIGCGDGFLTRSILNQTKCNKVVVYEIDPEWADFVRNDIKDPRLTINLKNILEVDFSKELDLSKKWVILANLPYQITFPILFLIQKNKHLFQEGVVMIQEEVARKILADHGKGFSSTSMFLQYHFELKLLEKIEPGAFSPPPKVFSRLIYFKPKLELQEINQEEEFWKFLKTCFLFPRRTLLNNLRTTHYDLSKISQETLALRSQQMKFEDFLEIWENLNNVL